MKINFAVKCHNLLQLTQTLTLTLILLLLLLLVSFTLLQLWISFDKKKFQIKKQSEQHCCKKLEEILGMKEKKWGKKSKAGNIFFHAFKYPQALGCHSL